MVNIIRWLENHPGIACNLAVFYAGMIFLLSSVPVVPRPPGPSNMMYVLHFIEYLGFGALILVALRSRKASNNVIALAVACAVFYALTDEVHQFFVPNRSASLMDWFFDSMGSAAGALSSDLARRSRI